MNQTLKITLIVVAVLFGAALLLAGGIFIGRVTTGRAAMAYGQFPLMTGFNRSNLPYSMGPGMMDRGLSGQVDRFAQPDRSLGRGPGMMGRGFSGQFDRFSRPEQSYNMNPWMMGRGAASGNYTGDLLSIEEVKLKVEDYLAVLKNDDLVVAEIMVFQENGYAVIKEKSTGMAAMELLVDHATGNVFPEYGPNMMWNLKFGMMSAGRGNFSGRAGGAGVPVESGEFEFEAMPVSPEEARTSAQGYLDQAQPGAAIAEEGFAFYGYYTFDYEVGGAVVGMLSVNGYSADIWPHTWHGEWIEEAEFD